MATMSALGPAGAWEIASTRSPPFIAKPDEHRSSGGGPANEDYNIMACRICINRFWLVFPFYTCIVGVNHRPWMPIDTQTKDYAASMRSAWVAPISPNKLLESWTDTLQKSIQSWQFPLPYKYDIISEPMRCLATEGTWQWGSCMQIWCTGCTSPIHHLNVSPGANFVDPVQEKADKNPYCHKASWWHCALLMHLLEPRTVLWCLHHDVK